MPHVVTENCIKCKHMECVTVCPVDCFHEGENFLAIDPDVCIDCGVCIAACPVEAIVSDLVPDIAEWLEINSRFSALWPKITYPGVSPPDADQWRNVPGKRRYLSGKPGRGS